MVMNFLDIKIKNEYRSLIDDISRDFYIPLLNKAVMYKRAVGFFSSSALVEISKGITGLVKNGGKIHLVASPRLSDEDITAMKKGYELRNDIIEKALLRELYDASTSYENDRLNLLANLIADGILDIKIAFIKNEHNIGMYHEKMGIIEDSMGNKVAFAGSMNETITGLMVNYESIDVFCSWTEDRERVLSKENAFSAIWNNIEPNIEIIDFPNVKKEIIEKYKKLPLNLDEYDKEIHETSLADTYGTKRIGAITPQSVKLHEYQEEAIREWEKQGFRGIFDMATGTGKTFTGLGGVARLCEITNDKLAVIVVCPYQHLVEQWVEDIKLFGINPIIGYSKSPQKDWRKSLTNAVRDQKLKVRNKEFFTFICTNATFTSDIVQTQISKIKGDTLLVVDEAHNFGSKRLSSLLDGRFNYRLALSATLERHNDEDGTESLYGYFGNKCIEYTLDRAIQEHKLTPYKYYPIIVTLTDDEREAYSDLSYQMSRNLIKGKNGKTKLSKYGEILALKRARIVAAASQKISALEKEVFPYKGENYILVYCGAANMLSENDDTSSFDDIDLRQIDVVTQLLGDKLDMKVSQFTSKEDVEERAILKKQFEKGENLQALIAIKCLDEGVNIPKIKVAFILASTTNPKEYIQRRGRVLRLAKEKEFAEIYDFVTLPRPLDEVSSLTLEEIKRDKALVKNEMARMEEFGRLSMNPMQSYELIWNIKEVYGINDENIEFSNDF